MRLAILFSLLAVLLPAAAPAYFVLLDADFDDKTVDQPIGTGGADVGEPVDVNDTVSAIVRDTPFPTPNLELMQTNDVSTGYVVFEFVDLGSVDVGNVFMEFDIRFSDVDSYGFKINEQGGWGSRFCDVYTDDSGNIRLTDAAGYVGTIGSYVADQAYHFEIRLDTEADTYDVLIDDTPVVEDRAHGIVGVGVGRLSFRITNGTPNGATLLVDDVLVYADEYTPVLDSSFSDLKANY